jgi:hypothetical protein
VKQLVVNNSKLHGLFANALASGEEEDVPVLATYAGQVLRIMDALKRVRRQGDTSGLEMQRGNSIVKRLYVSTVMLFS